MLLTPSQTRRLWEHALKHRYAVLAVNADSPAAVLDCLEAALAAQSPIVIETSLWQLTGRSFGAGDPFLGMTRFLGDLAILAESERYRSIPVVYHTDHIKGPPTLPLLQAAIRGLPLRLGGVSLTLCASSISLDSSELTTEQNLHAIATLCQTATASGQDAALEMEAGVDDGVTSLQEARALFGAAESAHPGYLALWAPGVGTQHGLGDNQAFSPQAVADHQHLASELAGRPIGIALHGSSGLHPDQLAKAVSAGACKVNWSSESLLIRSQAASEFYRTHQDHLQKGHPDFKVTAMDNGVQSAVSQAYIPRVTERLQTLGSHRQAPAFCQEMGLPADT